VGPPRAVYKDATMAESKANTAEKADTAEPAARRWSERERFIWKNQPRRPLSDVYHAWLNTSWRSAIGLVFLFYTLANLIFGAGYYLIGGIENARHGSFADSFFFSVQTLATIGYGKMVPLSMAANVLVSIEALCGIVGTAMMTGLLFAKFARPTARVLFSKVAVIAPHDGVPSLQFRLANERGNRIVEAQLRVTVLRTQDTKEGVKLRRQVDLPMLRDRSAVFALTWTAIHLLDEQSPLFGMSQKDWVSEQIEMFVTVLGLDETFSQTIHARHLYSWDEVLFGYRFVDVISLLPDGRREIDYAVFHEVKQEG
jgi:inward rectifier potassium channel